MKNVEKETGARPFSTIIDKNRPVTFELIEKDDKEKDSKLKKIPTTGKKNNIRPVSTVFRKSVTMERNLQMIKDENEDSASDTGNMLNELQSSGSSL